EHQLFKRAPTRPAEATCRKVMLRCRLRRAQEVFAQSAWVAVVMVVSAVVVVAGVCACGRAGVPIRDGGNRAGMAKSCRGKPARSAGDRSPGGLYASVGYK